MRVSPAEEFFMPLIAMISPAWTYCTRTYLSARTRYRNWTEIEKMGYFFRLLILLCSLGRLFW